MLLILNRKRISLIILAVVLGVFTFAYQEEKQKLEIQEYVTSIPVSDKVVILDAGHGNPDKGAESNNGTTESDINLAITLKVQNLLEQSGCVVLLTRSDENGIYSVDSKTLKEKKVSDIKNRVKIGNNSSADIFVSIHLNKIPQEQYYGWQCFYKKENENSKKLAENIQKSLNESIEKENKREALSITDKYIVEHVEIPLSIVECGFLSNSQEEKELKDDEYQNRLAWGIYCGIVNYFI